MRDHLYVRSYNYEWVPGPAVAMILFATAFAAWGTHVGWVIKLAAGTAGFTIGQAVLSFIGVTVPPVGVIHGFMIWLGL